jgi:hypothetical protein
MRKPNPCYKCPDKGCGAYHSICPRYLEWKEAEENEKKKIAESKMYCSRSYIKESAFKSRTHGAFKSKKK